MKKIISLIFIGVLVLGLAGCSKAPTPSETAAIFLDNIKADKGEKDGNTDFDLDDSLGDGPIGEAFEEYVIPKIYDFDYEIKGEKISKKNPDKAVVTVEITTYSIGKAYEEFLIEFIEVSIQKAEAGEIDESDLDAISSEIITKKFKNMKKDYKKNIELTLTKKDDKWVVDEPSNETIDAFTGGLFTTIMEFNQKLESGELQ